MVRSMTSEGRRPVFDLDDISRCLGTATRGCASVLTYQHRVRKVAHFPIFMNLELFLCEIFDCKESAFFVCEA